MQKNGKSLPITLIVGVLALNLFMAGLLAFMLDTSKARKEAEVRTTVANLALLLEKNVSSSVRQIDLSLQGIKNYLEHEAARGRGGERGALNDMLDPRDNWLAQFAEIRITDADGAVRHGHRAQDADTSYADREHFQVLSRDAGHGMRVSKLLLGRISNGWIVVFARRYNHPDGRFAGIITAAVPAAHFQTMLRGLDLGLHGIALLRDLDMTLVARHPATDAPGGQVGIRAGSPELTHLVDLGVERGTFYSARTADGVTRINAYQRVQGMPAFVVAGLGEEDYLLQWHEDVRQMALVQLVFLIVTVIAAWLLWRLIQSFQRVAEDQRIGAAAFEGSLAAIFITGPDKVILNVNPVCSEVTGYSREEMLGSTPALFRSGRHDASFYQLMWDSLLNTGGWQGEIWNRRKNGELFPAWLQISCVKDAHGQLTHYVSTFSDLSENRKAEETIHALAYYDPLTGLPNRRHFLEVLATHQASAPHTKGWAAVLYVDLDDFKTLNDARGQAVGDHLLQEMARRLQSCLSGDDVLARLNGDEFCMVHDTAAADAQEAARLAERLATRVHDSIRQPVDLDGIVYHGKACIGISLCGGDPPCQPEELLSRADAAMTQAKNTGRDKIHFFDAAMQAALEERVQLESCLRLAIPEQLRLHCQPQVDAKGQIFGGELLLRWEHPVRGMVSPAAFIPLAEETGLILPIGAWVLESACRQLAAWAGDPRTADLLLAVNVSARQFNQPDFVDQVLSTLARTGANPARLKLELTESMLAQNIDDIIVRMGVLKARGVRFSLDDFGTGFSSLSYLKRLPIDQLKIDQSFVRDLNSDPNSAAIVRTVIALGHSLGLAVIAEGVETAAHRDFLVEHGCVHFQGYFFGRPQELAEFERRL